MQTLSGQILVLLAAILGALGAILGAGGGLRYFLEPLLKRGRLRRVMASNLWLSCYELRHHIEEIKAKLQRGDSMGEETRDALLKIPKNDFRGRPDWLVKTGYLSMITAYRITAFSSWMRIYQTAVLQALLTVTGSNFISWLLKKERGNFIPELFKKFDAFKVAASDNTHLWYNYIDAIGEKIIVTEEELKRPLGFSEFCKHYAGDEEFLYFFDQLHMFIHFIGRKDEPWAGRYSRALGEMINALQDIEDLIVSRQENLLRTFRPKERNRTDAAELSKSIPDTPAPHISA